MAFSTPCLQGGLCGAPPLSVHGVEYAMALEPEVACLRNVTEESEVLSSVMMIDEPRFSEWGSLVVSARGRFD